MRSGIFANDVGYPCTLSSPLKELENLHYCAGVISKGFSGCANSAGTFKFNTLFLVCPAEKDGVAIFDHSQPGTLRQVWLMRCDLS